jgi:hypothetical protein
MLARRAEKRLVTRVWLMAELNARLRSAERLDPRRSSCRVKQLSPLNEGRANWAAELFEVRSQDPCIDHVTEIVSELQQTCDVAW